MTDAEADAAPTPAGLAERFAADRRLLWALAYRLTGDAADADDVVQETFLRALKRPPPRTDRPWRPWLVRVALNLGRDLLRRRRRRRYPGPWLPSPVPGPEPVAERAGDGPAARYDLVESVSFAFLLALEALSPGPRAVLLLRDVFDYSVRETARALGLSEANVKTAHLRARRRMARYDRERREGGAALAARTRASLESFLACLAQGDVAGMESLLAADVRSRSDGGGRYVSALRPILGPTKVARFFLGISRRAGAGARFELRTLNGGPALVAEFSAGHPDWAPRVVLQCDVDDAGRIRELYAVLAPRKLTAVV